MKIKNGKRVLYKYKNQLIITSKIKNALSFFNKTEYPSKIVSKNYSHSNFTEPSLYNKSFSKTTTNLNNRNRNLSFNKNNSDTFIIEPKMKNLNILNTTYENTFYPNSLKNKDYIREIYNSLPILKISNNENDNNKNDEINKNDNSKVKEILLKGYNDSVSNFNNIYKNSGEDLINEIKTKGYSNGSLIYFVKNNAVNRAENNYISSIIKGKRKNYSVEFENENFVSPKNSLMTLKINNQLIKNISDYATKYEYNSYAEKINENQIKKLKLLIMPKLKIKLSKFSFDHSNTPKPEKEKSEEESTKRSYYKKYNEYLHENSKSKKEIQKIDKKRKLSKINDNTEETTKFEEKTTIDSVNMRNSLISEVKSYYCKYLKRSVASPSSRIFATFTKYKSKFYLFGGSSSDEENELWVLEIKTKGPSWKKINYIHEPNVIFNKRYGHSCVYYNNNLYIFGGNINLKNLKNTLEDILIYNFKSNILRTASFKKEKVTLTSPDIYIPQRRNHIAHVIGWNMVVHGGIDITKEYSKENVIFSPLGNETGINSENNSIKNNETFILNDWMMLDLITLKWSKMNNILYKLRDKKMMKIAKLTGGISRVYHSSCLVLSYDNVMKGNKINIFRNSDDIKYDIVDKNKESDVNEYDFANEGKYKFDVNYEGIYIFGGLDENLKETNDLFILHCFRNPLIFFEPQIKGIPPAKRSMATINYDKNLNIITLYGGKDVYNIFSDLFILDIMNFEWIKINLFGPESISKKMGHCSGIIKDELFIFGGCDENNKFPSSKILCIDLDLLKNKNTSKIYHVARESLKQSPKDAEGNFILKLLREGNEIPKNLFKFRFSSFGL